MGTNSIGTIRIAGFVFEIFEIIPVMKTDSGINISIATNGSLNRYGNSLFCRFALDPLNPYYNDSGLYCLMVGNSVKYIGQTTSSYSSRINAYGNITPGVCGKSGQSTNCRINSLINKALDAGLSVRIGFCPFKGETIQNDIIKNAEKKLLGFRFEWNIQLS